MTVATKSSTPPCTINWFITEGDFLWRIGVSRGEEGRPSDKNGAVGGERGLVREKPPLGVTREEAHIQLVFFQRDGKGPILPILRLPLLSIHDAHGP